MTDLEAALQVTFVDRDLLDLALSHRSWAFEAGGAPTNERLEFLGDAVLGMVVTDHIYRSLPHAPEGRLAKLRAATVNTASLAEVARNLDLGEAVKLGRGEEQSGGRDKSSILADTLEALIGAVYVDQGMSAASDLVHLLFVDVIAELTRRGDALDFKTALQELTAARLQTLPSYQLTEEGPDHEKRFTARAVVGGEQLGSGGGRSKKEAEQQAAQEALAVLAARTAEDSGSRRRGPHDDQGAAGAAR